LVLRLFAILLYIVQMCAKCVQMCAKVKKRCVNYFIAKSVYLFCNFIVGI
jgi:hypothetical protein